MFNKAKIYALICGLLLCFFCAPADAITVVNQLSGSAGATGHTATCSSGTSSVNGDVLVVFLRGPSSGSTVTVPSGWTALANSYDGSGSTYGFYFLAVSVVGVGGVSAATSYSFSWSTNSSYACQIYELGGADTTLAHIQFAVSAETNGSANWTGITQITPIYAGEEALAFAGSRAQSGACGSFTSPSFSGPSYTTDSFVCATGNGGVQPYHSSNLTTTQSSAVGLSAVTLSAAAYGEAINILVPPAGLQTIGVW